VITWAGRVWRHVPAGGFPLNFAFIVKARGRWNRAGRYGCLYTSTTREGAMAEYRKLVAAWAPGLRLAPRELVSIDVHRVEPVLDLTDGAERKRFRVRLDDLTRDTDAAIELCRTLSDAARRAGAVGLLAPSAALAGAINLMIYQDGLAGGIDLAVGPDRDRLPLS